MNSIITNHDYTLDLLEDIIQQAAPVQTDLIVCCTKEDFFSQILAELHRHHLERLSPETSLEEDGKDEEDESSSSNPTHILLSKALHVLNSSQHVKLIFCPTITIFRGFLSSYVPRSAVASQPHGPIVILNLLAMHHGTSEFTLQGISQTLATAVSAAHRTGHNLRLVECKDIRDPANPNRGPALWQAEVQLLSAAIKIGEVGQNWGRRTISVMKIASRWFEVDENKQPHEAKRGTAAQEMMSEEEMVG